MKSTFFIAEKIVGGNFPKEKFLDSKSLTNYDSFVFDVFYSNKNHNPSGGALSWNFCATDFFGGERWS